MLEVLRQDFKYALRQLAKAPVVTAATVLILALGIGANTAVFSMVNGVLLRPLPFEHGDRLVLVNQQMPEAGIESFPFSPPEVADYREQSQTLDAVVEYHSMWFTLLGGDEPRRVQTGVVSANYFEALGTRPLFGRSFLPEDGEPGAEPVLLLSHGYWQRELGGDPGVVGRTFEMNDKIHTAVGILPPLPPYPDDNHVFITTSSCPFRSRESVETNRNARMLTVFGRLKTGVTAEQARSDVALVADRLLAEYPEAYADGEGYSATVVPLGEELVGEARPTLFILLATVALVLLVTCANLANLTFTRLVRRKKELAVRSAMGASQGRLVRLLLTESTVTAILGGALGLFVAAGALELLIAYAGRFTVRAEEITVDAAVLLFTLGVSLVTGLAIGLLPALYSRQTAVASLREGGSRAGSGVGFKRLRSSLIVAELAVSVILLIGAGLLVRSLFKLQRVDAGFETYDVLTVQVSLNWSKYGAPEDRGTFFSRLLERAGALPGARMASLSGSLPLNDVATLSRDLEIEGELYEKDRPRPRADLRVVSPGYFETLGVPLLEGRDFLMSDEGRESLAVAIVNRSLARRHWGEQDPLGKRLSLNRGKSWYTIVGVVGDVRHHGLDRDPPDEVYVAYFQLLPLETNLLVRSALEPAQLVTQVREVIREMDPEQPLAKIATMDQIRRKSLASPRLTMVLLGLFAGLALLISVAGLGSVIAYSVSLETQEIGVRMALGAGRGQVLWSVLRGSMALVSIGLAAGIVAGLFLTKLMESLLFAVEPTDLVTFLGVSLLLAFVAGMACLVPAHRATRVDPVTALRCE